MVKIAVRPLKGEQFEVEVDGEATVQDLKTKISETKADLPADMQKLIHAGKILNDASKVSETGIKEGEFVVVMVTKAKAPTGAAPAAATPAAAPQPTPAAAPPAAAPTDSSGDAPMSYETAASNVVTGGAMEGTIAQLCDMGYPRDQVERAMQAAFNNPDRAVEYLLSGIPETAQPAPGGGGVPGGGGDAPGGGIAPAPAAPAPTATGGATPFPAMVPGMGAGGGGGGGASMEALQELRNHPQFNRIAQMVAANPASLGQMLSALQQTNPELVQAIQENPEDFMQMLMQAAGGGAPQDPVATMLAAADGGQPGQTVIRLSEDEKAAVERICALGFDRNQAIQAYLACEKNEEVAANFLFENQD